MVVRPIYSFAKHNSEAIVVCSLMCEKVSHGDVHVSSNICSST